MSEKILKITKEVIGKDVDENSNLTQVSSLKKIQIIMALDEEGIKVPIEQVAKIKTVADLIAIAE